MKTLTALVLCTLAFVPRSGFGAPPDALCGRIFYQKRPFPAGYVSLSNEDGRAPDGALRMVRFKDGRFCLPGVRPGDYRLKIHAPAIAVADGSAGKVIEDLADYRVSVGPARPELRFDLPEPRARRPAEARLEGAVRWPEAIAPGAAPAYLFLSGTRPGADAAGYLDHFFWLDGEGRSFSVPSSPGRLLNFWVRAGPWTTRSIRVPRGRPGEFKAGTLEVALGPSSGIEGTVLLPGGAPYRPAPDAADKSHVMLLRVTPSWGTLHLDADYVDGTGRYELTHLAPGFMIVTPLWSGPGFRWSPGPSRALWLGEGKTARMDWALAEPADIVVEPASALGGYDSPRRLVGLEPGPLTPEKAAKLIFNQEAAFSLRGESRGRGPSGDVRPAAGRYDAYFVEGSALGGGLNFFAAPRVRILEVLRDVHAGADGPAVVRLAADPARFGAGEIRGSIKGAPAPKASVLLEARSFSALYASLVPAIFVYDASGALAAAAFPSLSAGALADALDAAGRGDDAGLEEILAQEPGQFQISGLPAGEYRVEISARGENLRTERITAPATGHVRLDVDLRRRSAH